MLFSNFKKNTQIILYLRGIVKREVHFSSVALIQNTKMFSCRSKHGNGFLAQPSNFMPSSSYWKESPWKYINAVLQIIYFFKKIQVWFKIALLWSRKTHQPQMKNFNVSHLKMYGWRKRSKFYCIFCTRAYFFNSIVDSLYFYPIVKEN